MYISTRISAIVALFLLPICIGEATFKPLRWGIVSSGLIASDFVNALSTLPDSEHIVVAIAARNESDAIKFAEYHNISKAYGGYEKLAKDPDVDVVFIGTINLVHFDNAKLMIENKKHVVVTKPMTLNAKQTKGLVELAKANNVFLMEAMWPRFTPAYKKVKELLDGGELGTISLVVGTLGVEMPHVPRVMRGDLGGGSTLDIGVYPLQLQQFVYGSRKPQNISVTGTVNELGADTWMSGVITYSESQRANVYVSLISALPNDGYIVGEKAVLRIPQINCPEKLILTDKSFNSTEFLFPLKTSHLTYNYPNTIGFIYEIEEVRQCLIKGLKESPLMSWQDSIQLAEWTDEIRRQLGVHYDADDD